MLDRLSSLLIAITFIVMAVVIAAIYGGDWVSLLLVALAGVGGAAILYSAAPGPITEPTADDGIAAGKAQYHGSILLHKDFARWADQESEPVLGISDHVVTIANDAAIALLGRHIMGADIRTAIRHPAAAELLHAPHEESGLARAVNLIDYPRSGHRWSMRLARLSGRDMIIFLEDRSAIDAADRMRSDFVANASHELRTPLAAILGYVETLQDMQGSDDPTQQRFLSIIEREARRMQQLVLDLLSISRVEANRFRRPTEEINLTTILSSSIKQLKDIADDRSQDIIYEAGSQPLTIAGDQAQLMQLTHNIVTNAMKYGHKGTPIYVTLEQQGRRAILTVQDQGEGIAADHLPRLTERFYRVDDARSRSVGGTGLGLAIVKHITERHQGQLAIESSLGKGTRITLSFPLLAKMDAS